VTPELLAEMEHLERRVAAKRTFNLDKLLFPKQLAFVRDPATFATASCTRRAGKSVGIGAWLLEGPLKNCGPSLYFTITRKKAKEIIWPVMLRLNREHRLGYKPNESDLTLSLDGIPCVFLMGVDNKGEIEKARGTGWGRVAGDEAQILPQYVEDMVNDVLMPSFMDHDGKIRLIGTPGAVPVGYFHDTVMNPEWSAHAWSVWENPHLPGARAMLDKVLKVRGVTESHPSIQREWMGRWVYDPDSLVFQYVATTNDYGDLPERVRWQHVLGVDLGYDDADALALLAFSEDRPEVYLREEWVGPKQTITQLAERLQVMIAKHDPVAVVMDTGGLGKKIAEEIRSRHQLPIKPAEKSEKFTHIELVNDALRSGRMFARKDSRFAQDSLLVEWDKERSTADRRVISDRFHSDICDAVLYAYRESLHWMHVPADPKPKLNTAEGQFAEQQTYEEQLEAQIEARKNPDAAWMQAGEPILDDGEWP